MSSHQETNGSHFPERSSELEGRHVVVTGANGELGGVVARLLADRGAHCHLPVRSAAKAASGGPISRMHFVEGVNLVDERSVSAFYRDLPALWASIHCAGGFRAKAFADTSLEDLQQSLATNTTTSFVCSREAVRKMRTNEVAGGWIVNVVSRQALEPERGAGMVAYTMSKAAVAALTRALAEEVSAAGIAVHAVAPSILDTPLNRAAMPQADFSRWVSLDEVARAILELVSPVATRARGEIVPIYGRV